MLTRLALSFVFVLTFFATQSVWDAPAQSHDGAAAARELPAHFEAHRIYVHPVTAEGDTLRLYTDTGGGGPFLLDATVERLGLPIVDTVTVEQGRPAPRAKLPDLRTIPTVREDRAYVFPANAMFEHYGDGLLGQSWFADRIWTFDYATETLRLHPPAEGLAFDPAHTVPLGFKTDSTGARVNSFPSVEATIDGETYAFLFDTGAELVLTDSARAVLGGPKAQGTSFIVASIFDRWRGEHPDWRVIEGAQRIGRPPRSIDVPIIEVPAVTIAGHTVGPVWFTKRPDANFHAYMSSMMDRRVEGALGGSLFQYFAITVDYPDARAVFERRRR